MFLNGPVYGQLHVKDGLEHQSERARCHILLLHVHAKIKLASSHCECDF